MQSFTQPKANGRRLPLALHAPIVNGWFHRFLCTVTFPFLFQLQKQENGYEATGITRGPRGAQHFRKTELAFAICLTRVSNTARARTAVRQRKNAAQRGVLGSRTARCHQASWMPRGFPSGVNPGQQ